MLEINDVNVREMLNLVKLDRSIRSNWVKVKGKSLVVLIPDTTGTLQKFIEEWIQVCPSGTAKKIKEFNKSIKKNAKKAGIQLDEFKSNLLIAREVARIKKEYASEHSSLAKRVTKQYNVGGRGYTHLLEIIDIMNEFLVDSEKKYPKLISICEGKNIRRSV